MRHLLEKIKEADFPCLMAKSLLNMGCLRSIELGNLPAAEAASMIYESIRPFIDNYRANSHELHSFIVSFKNARNSEFADFNVFFWDVLRALRSLDSKFNFYDRRVSSDPSSPNFSFSIHEEAFFILLLHPSSPRLARRFSFPSIVFNPHQQFESMRSNGIFEKFRSLIRARDEKLQGSKNLALADFGSDSSEVLQYSGSFDLDPDKCPLNKIA